MKRLTQIALTSLTLTLVCATMSMANVCDRLQVYSDHVTTQQLTADLLTGAWITELDGKESALYFREDGLVEVMSSSLPGQEYEIDRWMVVADCGKMQLMMSGPDKPMRVYRIEPTCDGFAFIDDKGIEGFMVKRHSNIKRLVHRMRDQIAGTWMSNGTSSRKHDIDLSWTFAENGTFAINTGPDKHHTSYEGVWDISPDGTNVVLFFGNSENPEDVYARHLLKVHALDFEDMVMSGEPISNLIGIDDKKKVRMFFEKNYIDN